jgi:hypothetical protein
VRIAPRDAKACSVCDLKPLCRVAILDEGEEAEENGDE